MLPAFAGLASVNVASAQSITEFNTALDSAVATSTAMIGSLTGKGVLITLAVITAVVVLVFIKIGWRKGMKGMNGRV